MAERKTYGVDTSADAERTRRMLDIRASIVKQLREILAQAEAGDIEAVIILALHPNGEWSNKRTVTLAQYRAVKQYLASQR